MLTTKSTVECIKYLLNNGYHYVLTRVFNSDPIESLFSALRQMNGGNDTMDVRAALFAIEKILKTGKLITSKYSNRGKADGIICTSMLKIKKRDAAECATSVTTIPEEVLDILNCLLTEQGKYNFIFFCPHKNFSFR